MATLLKAVYQFLTSLRCAIIVLLIIAAASILGTILPQGITEEAVLSLYGETSWKARLILSLGLTDLYHTFWFQSLIVLLAINVTLCTSERFPKTLRLWNYREKESSRPDRLKKFSNFSEFSTQKKLEDITPSIRRFFIGGGWKRELENEREQTYEGVFSKRQVFIFSIYGVHLSILLILIGAFVGSFFGFKGTMAIIEGESTNVVKLMRKDKALLLPFEVRCDSFDIKFYPDGTPSDYISKVTVLEKGREVQSYTIRVNDPATYRGVSFYQATYGALINRAKVSFTDEQTGESFEMILTTESEETIPERNVIVQLMDYRENFSNFGPAVAIGMLEEGKAPRAGWILVNHPNFHGNRLGPYRVTVKDVEASYYTGLQVKRDPGIWIVLAGFLGLAISMLATFYGNPVKVWCFAERFDDNITRIYIAMKSKGFSQSEKFAILCKNFVKIL